MKYEKEFRQAHPETIGDSEIDAHYDFKNYADFLEKELEASKEREVSKPIFKKESEEKLSWEEIAGDFEVIATFLEAENKKLKQTLLFIKEWADENGWSTANMKELDELLEGEK